MRTMERTRRQDTHADLISRLLALPLEIRAMKAELLSAQHDARLAEAALKERQYALLREGALTATNDKAREAQMWPLTVEERRLVNQTADQVSGLRVELEKLQDELSALRAVARILGTDD
jgi:hypothetical protein